MMKERCQAREEKSHEGVFFIPPETCTILYHLSTGFRIQRPRKDDLIEVSLEALSSFPEGPSHVRGGSRNETGSLTSSEQTMNRFNQETKSKYQMGGVL